MAGEKISELRAQGLLPDENRTVDYYAVKEAVMPWPSFLDGIGNGLGYAMILVIVGAFREFFGRGSLLGFKILPQSLYDAGYMDNGMMTMPAMALILLGCVIWIHRSYFYKEDKK